MTGFRASLAESAAYLMIIHNARVLTFDSTNRVLDSGAVEILPDGSIGQIEDSVVGRTGTARRTLLVRGRAKNEEGTANHSPLIHGRDSNAEGTASRTRTTPPDHEIIDAQGKLLMPALINCHTHLYSTLARGISLPGRAPRNFTGDSEEALVAAGPRPQSGRCLLQRAGGPD